MLIRMAWRNIWRSRRRSLITMSSVMFALFFAIVMRAFQLGSYDRMIDNVVSSFSGYLQVHAAGYWDDQVIDNAMPTDDLPQRLSKRFPELLSVYPRVESFALAASGEKTRGVLVVGLDPLGEDAMLDLIGKVQSGSLAGPEDAAVMIGDRLAENLNVVVGDTLVILGQGYQGRSAAGKYPVSAILSFPAPQMSASLVLLPLNEAHWLFSTDGLATSLVIRLENRRNLEEIHARMEAAVDTTIYEVLTWEEMMPELVQMIQADSSGGIIMVVILYLVISFGVFGTLLMMLNERQYEFGVLLAIGMSRIRLTAVVLMEMIILAAGGVLGGALLALPINWYFVRYPYRFTGKSAAAMEELGWEAVLASSTDPGITLNQAVIVFVVTFIITLYAVVVLARLKPVDAMRA